MIQDIPLSSDVIILLISTPSFPLRLLYLVPETRAPGRLVTAPCRDGSHRMSLQICKPLGTLQFSLFPHLSRNALACIVDSWLL
jgi:hypothetical protein